MYDDNENEEQKATTTAIDNNDIIVNIAIGGHQNTSPLFTACSSVQQKIYRAGAQ